MDYPRSIDDKDLDDLKNRCRICGKLKKLTKEHIPPKCIQKDWYIDTYIPGDDPEIPNFTKHKIRKDISTLSLCSECNNNLGRRFVPEYNNFVSQFNTRIIYDNIGNYMFSINEFYPMRVIKQIYSMVLSSQSIYNPYLIKLQRYILDYKLNMNFLPNVFMYYNKSSTARLVPCVGRLSLNNHSINMISEISFPHIAFVISDESTKDIPGLLNISYFNQYSFYDKINQTFRLPHHFVDSSYPLGFGHHNDVEIETSKKMYVYLSNDKMSELSKLIKLGAIESPQF